MDEMIDDALRRDETRAPRQPFFRYAVMRRVRGEALTPPLRFPWRIAAALGGIGAVAGAFVDVQQFTTATLVLLAMVVIPALSAATRS